MITVNGEIVDPDLIEEAFFRIKSGAETLSEVSCCGRDEEFRRQAEDEVIDGILLAQEAERQSAEPEASEVRSAMEETIRQWRAHGASWDLLEHRREEMRQEVIADLKMQQFVEGVCGDLPPVDEDACRRWYDAHAESFRTPARVRALHLVRFPDGRSVEEEYRFLVDLRREVLDGADFETLANTHTDKADGAIDLGWLEHQRVLHEFEAVLFSLREHEVSPVIFYQQALHLAWVESLVPESVTPYEEVAEEVESLALADRRREALAAVAREARERAKIERE